MEYVIRLEDKRLYDALLGFLRSLGAKVKGTDAREAASILTNSQEERNQALNELLEFAEAHPLKLPEDYRFNREELYDE